jgi:hypothetical protein
MDGCYFRPMPDGLVIVILEYPLLDLFHHYRALFSLDGFAGGRILGQQVW